MSVKYEEVTSSGVFSLTSSLGAYSLKLVIIFFFFRMKWLAAALIIVNNEQTLLKIFHNLQGLS